MRSKIFKTFLLVAAILSIVGLKSALAATYDYYLGEKFTVEYPTGSGRHMNLWEVSKDLSRRMVNLFVKDAQGNRPVNGNVQEFQKDPHWSNYVLFYEYFHGDNGRGVGASHQTGWTGLAAKLIQQSSKYAHQNNERGMKRQILNKKDDLHESANA